MIIVRVKHFYDVSRKVLLFYRLMIIAFIERIQMETLYRLRIPDTKRINDTIAVANDRNIIRNCFYRLITFLSEIASAVLIYINIDITAELYFFSILRPTQFKWISIL